MVDLSDFDRGWLVAMFDGEGWVQRTGTGPQLCVANTDRWLLERVQALVGGHISERSAYRAHPRWRRQYEWRLSGRRAVEAVVSLVLADLSPRRQEQIAAALAPTTDEERAKQREIGRRARRRAGEMPRRFRRRPSPGQLDLPA